MKAAEKGTKKAELGALNSEPASTIQVVASNGAPAASADPSTPSAPSAPEAGEMVPATGVDPTILRNIPLFSKLGPAELLALTCLLKAHKFPASTPVMFIGDDGSEFYIVQVGRVEISQPDEAGQEVRLAELGPGQFFGEISLLDGGPRTATVRAVNDVILLALNRPDFVEVLLQHPSAAVHILTILGHRQRDLLEKLRGIRNVNEAIGGGQTRLEWALSKVANLFSSEKFLLANLLGILTWVVVHSFLWPKYARPGETIDWADKPPTFFWLGFMITVEAIVISIFVLNSQRRQADRDRIRGDLEYQVNVKAHMEVMELQRKVDRLLEAQKKRDDEQPAEN